MPNIRVVGSIDNAALILEWVDPITGVTKTALVLKHELTETRDPTILDDGTEGFERGSYWFNASTVAAFICINPATGAAQWRQMAGGGGGTGTSIAIVVESSSNIVIDGAGALPTIDGYSVQDGDRVLLTAQTSAIENGLWLAHAIGTAWERPNDFASGGHAAGRVVLVVKGTTWADSMWVCITDPPNDVIDTNNLSYEQIAQKAEEQVLYVGKHGNDSNSGKTIDQAKLTFGTAITAAGTPANEAAAFTVVCMDDGEYDEDLTCVDYVNIYAPSATLKGKQTLAVMHLTARRMINDGDNEVIVAAAAGTSFITVETIYSTATTKNAVLQTAGDLKVRVGKIETTVANAVSLVVDGAYTLDLEAQEIIAVTDCLLVSAFGSVVTARVGRMSGGTGINLNGTDEVDAVIGRLACTAAYDINAASTLRLVVGELSGTETAADGADVRVTRARRDNLVATTDPAVTDDDADGYTVGSAWINVSTDETFVCTDASTGAAIWKHVVTEVKNEATTNDATVTTLATIPIPDDTVVLVEVRVVARRTNAADRGVWIRRAAVFREAAGVATMVSFVDTPFTRESDPLWNATIDVNGNNARILVTGRVGHDVNWKSLHTVKEVS